MDARTNEQRQPIGPEVEGWEPRQAPEKVTLVGRYVTLEPLSADHVAPLFDHLCGEGELELWTYRGDLPPHDVPEMARWVAALASSQDTVTFALVPEGSEGAAGMVSLSRIDPGNGSIEVASVIYGRVLQRSRAGTEAIRLLGSYVFEDLGYRRWEWKCDSLNQPSRDAAQRCGFVEEGTFRNAVVYKGRSRDTTWFSVTDAEWPATRDALNEWLNPKNFDGGGCQRRTLGAVKHG